MRRVAFTGATDPPEQRLIQAQIFDYGNTAVEKRAIFFRQVLRLLEFGREREGIDLSEVVLTHHILNSIS